MEKTQSPGIYKIENLKTKKVYIGQAQNIYVRWLNHKSALKRGNHENSYLQRAWNTYNEEDFKFSILEKCSLEDLAQREQYWMDKTQCYIKEYGYNLNPSSTENPMLGRTHTPEAKAKISAAAKGRKMSKSNFEALMKANKGVAKPSKNLTKKKSRKVDTSKARNIKYEYHIFKPDGDHIMLTNLNEFCDINRCSISHLRGLIFKRRFYKNWTAIAIPLKPEPSNLLPKLKLLTLIKTDYNYA
jgi:group I intron endonuclease